MDQDMICQVPGCGHSVREHKPISATKYGLCLMAGCHCLGAELVKEEVAQATTAATKALMDLALIEGKRLASEVAVIWGLR